MNKKKLIQKELKKTIHKEKKILYTKRQMAFEGQIQNAGDKINKKLPFDAKERFNEAFKNAFKKVFEHGIKYIEKTYSKDKLALNYYKDTNQFNKKIKRRNIRTVERRAYKKALLNTGISMVEGAAVGFMGVITAIADVPVFISVVLKHLNETALHYGFNYNRKEEQIYMLKLIDMSISNGDRRIALSKEIDKIGYAIDIGIEIDYDIDETIEKTSQRMSESITASKLMQSIPVAGAFLGGINNYKFMRNITSISNIKYKKRYLYKMMDS